MKNRSRFLWCLLSVGAFLLLGLLSVGESVGENHEFKDLLLRRLVHVEPLPETSNRSVSELKQTIYILGGPFSGLEEKFKVASNLYHETVVSKVLFLSQPGMTEYSPKIGRNFTNDEWALEKLKGLGIPIESIEPVPIEKRFFGTLSEAQGISEIAVKRGYHQLILVTAPHHTMRTWMTFSKFLKSHDIKLYIYQSDDDVDIGELLKENFKYLIYKYILL